MAFINTKIETNTPLKTVWTKFTSSKDIVNWYFASDTWHCPRAKNNLKVGGKFVYHMAAKDKSFEFDFSGVYIEIEKEKKIVYKMDDDRYAIIRFAQLNKVVSVEVSFEAENQNSLKLQKQGWQAILNNFKKYIEK